MYVVLLKVMAQLIKTADSMWEIYEAETKYQRRDFVLTVDIFCNFIMLALNCQRLDIAL